VETISTSRAHYLVRKDLNIIEGEEVKFDTNLFTSRWFRRVNVVTTDTHQILNQKWLILHLIWRCASVTAMSYVTQTWILKWKYPSYTPFVYRHLNMDF